MLNWKKTLNLIRAYWDLWWKRIKPRAYPIELSLGTTSFCNLRCVMCPREDHQGNRMPFDEHLSMEYYMKLRPYLERAKDISLFGLGEPMIDRGYFEKVRYINSFGANVNLSTNGTLLDESRCRELLQTGVKAFGISLDAATEETYNLVRPPGGFLQILENIRRFQQMKKSLGVSLPVLGLSFGIMKQNLQDLPLFPDLAKDLEIRELVVHPVVFMSENAQRTLAVDREIMMKTVDAARIRAEQLGQHFMFWNLDQLTYLKSLQFDNEYSAKLSEKSSSNSSKKTAYFCSFLWRNAMIQGQGEVFPCCYMTNIKLGIVENGSPQTWRNHAFLVDLRSRLFAGNPPAPCASCPQLQPFNRRQVFLNALKELKYDWLQNRRS